MAGREGMNKLIAQKTGSEFNNFFTRFLEKGIVPSKWKKYFKAPRAEESLVL